jgi:tetratricopeptide (TPR) repeat protein
MRKMTRSQTAIIMILGVLVTLVCGLLVTIFVLNSQEILQTFTPATATLSPTPTVPTETPIPTSTATATPTFTPTPMPTLTPTPTAPQTSYDLQIANEPENPTLRVQRGYAYIELEAYTDAIADFDTAICLNATLPEAYLGRGEARFHTKEWSAALADLDQALALNPDLADAHAWRGYLLSERGEFNLGIEALQQAVTLDTADPVKHLHLAQAWLRSGNPVQAKAEFSTALSLESHSVEAYVGRAMAEIELEDSQAAWTDLSHAMSTAPFSPASLNGRARFYGWYQQDRLYESTQLAQQAISGAKDDLEKARYMHTLGWIYHLQGYHDQAITTLEEAAALATIEGDVIYDEILEHIEEIKAAQE